MVKCVNRMNQKTKKKKVVDFICSFKRVNERPAVSTECVMMRFITFDTRVLNIYDKLPLLNIIQPSLGFFVLGTGL